MDIIEKPTETTNLSSQSLNQPPGSLHGTDVGPMRMCDSCVVWSICGTPNSENRGCP